MRLVILSAAFVTSAIFFTASLSAQAEKPVPGSGKGSDKEMVIKRIVFDQNTQAPVVLLTDKGSDTVLPIWIGLCEARSIEIGVSDAVPPRPMTYDLIAS